MRAPPALRPGDPITIVAPAGPVPEERFAPGLARLSARYDVRTSERIFARDGFLAGDDAARRHELTTALASDTGAVLCARGGYGTMRLLEGLDVPVDKLLVGFSDITVLHAYALSRGARSIHGPVVTQLGAVSDDDAQALYDLLEGRLGAPLGGLSSRGARTTAEGLLVGGNLELVTRLVGTPWAFPIRDNVLLLEEVGERPYRIDRQLTQLRLSGALDGVRAIVVGELVRCEEDDMPSAASVVEERLASLGVPLLFGLPVGHGTRNRAVAHGARVRVDAAAGTLTFLEPAAT